MREFDGSSTLHRVVAQLQHSISGTSGICSPAVKAWRDFGIDILRRGVDIHYVPKQVSRSTAFLELLNCVLRSGSMEPGSMMEILSLWMEMVQSAGLDVDTYRERENEVLKRSKMFFGLERPMELVDIVASGLIREWSIRIRPKRSMNVYRLINMPGAFSTNPSVPPTVCWTPSKSELEEEHWTWTRMIDISSTTFDIRQWTDWQLEHFSRLIDQAQDDTGVVILLTDRSYAKRTTRRRSSSAPPPLMQRELAFFRGRRSKSHPWLRDYHLCPQDSRYKIGCCDWWEFSHVRNIMATRRSGCWSPAAKSETSVYDSLKWRSLGFLLMYEVARCTQGADQRYSSVDTMVHHGVRRDALK